MAKNQSEDLGVKIGSKEQVIWTDVLKEAILLVEQGERNLVIQRGIIDLANKKIAVEKEKFK